MRNIRSKSLLLLTALWLNTACTDKDYFKQYDLPESASVANAEYPKLKDTPAIPPEIESSNRNGDEIEEEILEIYETAKQRIASPPKIIDDEFTQRLANAKDRRGPK